VSRPADLQATGSVISINIILAFIGFAVGAAIGIGAFALVIEGARRETYQLMANRHPWIRLLSVVWILACGAVVAIIAYRLAG